MHIMHIIGTHRRAPVGQATQFKYLSNMIDGQNLSQTLGEPEFVAQQFCEIPASDGAVYLLASNIFEKATLVYMYCLFYGRNPCTTLHFCQ
jgi:hypothetical protein